MSQSPSDYNRQSYEFFYKRIADLSAESLNDLWIHKGLTPSAPSPATPLVFSWVPAALYTLFTAPLERVQIIRQCEPLLFKTDLLTQRVPHIQLHADLMILERSGRSPWRGAVPMFLATYVHGVSTGLFTGLSAYLPADYQPVRRLMNWTHVLPLVDGRAFWRNLGLDFVVGAGIAGAAALCTWPFEVIRTVVGVTPPDLVKRPFVVLSNLVHPPATLSPDSQPLARGPRRPRLSVLFHGLPTRLAAVMLTRGVAFASFDMIMYATSSPGDRDGLSESSDLSRIAKVYLTGTACHLVACGATYPLDTVRRIAMSATALQRVTGRNVVTGKWLPALLPEDIVNRQNSVARFSLRDVLHLLSTSRDASAYRTKQVPSLVRLLYAGFPEFLARTVFGSFCMYLGLVVVPHGLVDFSTFATKLKLALPEWTERVYDLVDKRLQL